MNNAKRLRYESGLSARAVAEKAGISVGTVYNIESGDTPTAQVAKALADTYKVPVAVLLGLDPLSEAA